ncbi:1-acyl-sn-glycerol-3-phosphate acyltransferase [Clostridium algifaecis]|uniref:1-acyl-sn-glycerol-3-phosphate acyltransferase n=1 Tax=Clostridium algifaecis TaxID=1472040 RepID=A0ABS4KVV7_9CLOT|nr:lysophospholipid acyltransferase family protein [Clostridium algifaecis]MBP2034147.1 1-acyl-sn-glycerol-3-phosphate acyltransferase [Clostridium algifaecis]
MISPFMVKVIGHLPKNFVGYASKKILAYYIKKYANINVMGMKNLEDVQRPILFVCNHLSNSDALVLGKVLKAENLIFVAGVKLNSDPLTKLGMSMTKTIGIKPNTADKEAISKIIKALKAGKNILMFPEGTRSRTSTMNKAKRGVVLIQKLTKARVVPVAIYGSEKLLPISNKGMSYESFHYAKVTVNIGENIQIPKKNNDEEKHEYENRVSDFMMYEIAKLLPEKYRGVYNLKQGDKFE